MAHSPPAPDYECRNGMTWRIKEDDLRNVQGHECLVGKTFKANIPGVTYYFKIYPNGRNESEENQVKIFFHLDLGIAKDIDDIVDMVVGSTRNLMSFKKENYNNQRSGDRTFQRGCFLCSRGELFRPNGEYFVDGFMELQFDVILSAYGIYKKASQPLSVAKWFWENENGKDMIIVAENQTLKVHKGILCTKSPVFKAELETEKFKEAQDGKIVISDFSFEVVKIAIKSCYEQNIRDLITEENVPGLLQFANKYDLKDLHTMLRNELIEKISGLNVVRLAKASITSNSLELREFCVCFLIHSKKKCSRISNIENLEGEIITEVGLRSILDVQK